MDLTNSTKLIAVKVIHTLIWVFFLSIIFYVLYGGMTNQVNRYTWIAIGLVVFEGLILLVFKMYCPLTLIARKYSDSTMDNFDIYLPNYLAKHNKRIFTTLFLAALGLVLYRWFTMQ